jgi:hypothetical protein
MNQTTQIIRLLQDSNVNEDGLPICTPEPPPEIQWYNFVVIIVLAMMSGMFSGLNLGLLGLDVKNLELLTRGPFNDE